MSADRLAGLGGDLRQRAVVVQAQHGGEVLARQVRRALHRDVGVGVGRVADHQHLDVAGSDGVQRLALRGEDLRVGRQQVLALHAGAARTGADQQRVVGILEGGHRVAVRFHAGQQREGAVLEFHHHALERLLCLLVRDLQQLQDDGLVLAQHLAGGDAEQQGVADLAGGAGNGNAHGFLLMGISEGRLRKRATAGRGRGRSALAGQARECRRATPAWSISYVLYKISLRPWKASADCMAATPSHCDTARTAEPAQRRRPSARCTSRSRP